MISGKNNQRTIIGFNQIFLAAIPFKGFEPLKGSKFNETNKI